MHWTHQDYEEQPQWFIDLVVERMMFEGEESKKQNDKAKAKQK